MATMFAPQMQNFRFYDDDAGEAASTPLQAQDVDHTNSNAGADVTLQIRILIQNTTVEDGGSMNDYRLEYDKNGTGRIAVPTSNSGEGISAATAGLTNDAATTDRSTDPITGGTGSFVAGEQSTDGTVNDMQLTGSNFTEHVWGVTMYDANLSDADKFDFYVAMSQEVAPAAADVPRITIDKNANVTRSPPQGDLEITSDAAVPVINWIRTAPQGDLQITSDAPVPVINRIRTAPQNDLSIDMKTPTATVPSHIREKGFRFRNDGPMKAS